MAQSKETSDTRALAAVLLGGGGIALAALVVTWQFYMWLKTGHWPDLTMASVALPLISGSDFSAWLAAPQSWIGLHSLIKFLINLPVWTWLCFCSAGLVCALLRD